MYRTVTSVETEIVIPAALGPSTVESFRAQLLSCVDDGSAVSLNGRRVERVDASGIQLLFAFVDARRARGLAVRWEGASHALRLTANLFGVADLLGLPG